MKALGLLALFTAVLALTGCASIVSNSKWPVRIDSNPSGQLVTVKNSTGATVSSGTTPLMVDLKSGDGYFGKAAYTIETGGGVTRLDPSFNWWYAGNIVFGGLIGMLIVDPLTGAMWRLPETVIIGPGGAAPSSPGESPYQ